MGIPVSLRRQESHISELRVPRDSFFSSDRLLDPGRPGIHDILEGLQVVIIAEPGRLLLTSGFIESVESVFISL